MVADVIKNELDELLHEIREAGEIVPSVLAIQKILDTARALQKYVLEPSKTIISVSSEEEKLEIGVHSFDTTKRVVVRVNADGTLGRTLTIDTDSTLKELDEFKVDELMSWVQTK